MPEWKGRVPLTRSHCERITQLYGVSGGGLRSRNEPAQHERRRRDRCVNNSVMEVRSQSSACRRTAIFQEVVAPDAPARTGAGAALKVAVQPLAREIKGFKRSLPVRALGAPALSNEGFVQRPSTGPIVMRRRFRISVHSN
ncbi:hypothetical protein EVAR_29413_1 [Eumeta japonica]|uniref:Uncharacterized protein n=1 Tax=Eumeta variegata TaxID=151549 RepID=A0A4C1VSH1_EUMVA|nr:hypothetical protein EVAR_29413_1 [Eumeta japonica]